MTEIEKQKILEEYCSNDMRKLKQLCYPKIKGIGGISEMDYDDFYSIALDVIRDTIQKYDESKGCKFRTLLEGNIQNKFNSEIRNRNRKKRMSPFEMIYIDALEEEGSSLGERIPSEFDMEKEVLEHINLSYDERVYKYLNLLSERQKKIAEMIMGGYSHIEIKERLALTESQYVEAWKDMRTFEKTRAFKHIEDNEIKEDKIVQILFPTQTLEKSKQDKLSILSIVKKIDNYTIRFDHPLQRESEQWSPAMKGNLISDILQGNPISPLVFAEQIVNGIAIIWDLDGKQRCTNAYSFRNDGYKITKNIRRWNISYQATIRDKNGKPVLDKNGFLRSEKREFDIRGKKYSDLPEELQDRYNDYNFEIVQYLNCSSEDIAYHIARYNEGKAMTASQKGLTRLGEEFAVSVKSISAMGFFKDLGGYKVSERNNGTINRVVVESVMAVNFLNEWKKKQEDMCEFIKHNATIVHFEHFEDMVIRITKTGTEETFNMFDSRDSFIWFSLFARFMDMGLEDKQFINFMGEFSRTLHSKKLDKISFDDLNEKSTKDKNVVVSKINHLEKLMRECVGRK